MKPKVPQLRRIGGGKVSLLEKATRAFIYYHYL